MVRRGLHRFIRRLSSESGQSLVLAFIVMCALSITVGGVISFTTSNESQFGRDRQLDRAFHIAEAGLNNGIQVVASKDPSNDPTQIGTRYPAAAGTTYSLSLDGGTGTYYVQKYAATSPECTTHAGSAPNSCWVIIATGNSPDGKILKQLQESIYWRTVTAPVDDVYGFGLFVANPPGPGACVNTHGTTLLDIDNIWINGDFCPSGGAGFEPTADSVGSVYIGGTYEGRNNTSIGTASRYYKNVNIAGGCTVQGGRTNCDPSANIYSRGPAAGAVGSPLQKPDIGIAAAALYASADWTHPTCLPATTPSPFDDPAHPGPNQSNPMTLFTGSSFDCKVVDNNNVTHRLQWNATTQTLSVQNGVYIDGDVSFPNGANTYSIGDFTNDTIGSAAQSNGTIYVNGVMDGSSNVNVCGPGTLPASPSYGCPLTWNPEDGQIGFAVINPLANTTGFSMTGNGELDITLIVNQGYADTGGTVIAGPVLADRATIGGNGGFVIPGNPPGGTPTDVTTEAAWVVQPGGWKEQK
jgi:hypothetical protein